MASGNAFISAEDASYFLNIAVIGGTLLGLTFIALSFFLLDLPKRYEETGLPVFRHRDPIESRRASRKMHPYGSLTDRELLDGDPLVVFIAFSVSVTWNLFLLPLTVGLTAAWAGVRLGVLATELCLFFCLLAFSFYVRNVKLGELRPYLTREELLWPFFGTIALFLYATAIGVVLVTVFSEIFPVTARLAVWTRWGVSNERGAVFLIKLVCILSLLLGTYTANKDMFVFFKTIAAERMRHRWLHFFVRETYRSLSDRVKSAGSRLPADSFLMTLWNEGYPDTVSTHDEFKKAGPDFVRSLWLELVQRRTGAASWMLDIPRIADWASRVEEALAEYEFAANAQIDNQEVRPATSE